MYPSLPFGFGASDRRVFNRIKESGDLIGILMMVFIMVEIILLD